MPCQVTRWKISFTCIDSLKSSIVSHEHDNLKVAVKLFMNALQWRYAYVSSWLDPDYIPLAELCCVLIVYTMKDVKWFWFVPSYMIAWLMLCLPGFSITGLTMFLFEFKKYFIEKSLKLCNITLFIYLFYAPDGL